MAKTTCKQCFRRFASPRALAGHMRSHSIAAAQAAAAAADAAAAAAVKQQISSASSASTSLAAADEDSGFKMPVSTYGLRENPKRSLRVTDAGFSDRESEAESTPPHAKRVNAAAACGEAEPVSSLSEVATPEEDVALSLMMLSRDSWPSGAFDGDDYSDDGSDDGYAPPAPLLPPPRAPSRAPVEKRTQFQCVACKKVFRSYQALGGHRASNVRGGRGGCCAPPVVAPSPPPPQPQAPVWPPLPEHHGGDEDVDAKQQPRECPHCYRVFASGQALGGHKRSHVCGAAAAHASTATAGAGASTSAAAPPSPINNPGMIDLNVAPPSEEVELSAVSDPRFNPGA
jgi:hypothetical protein